MRGDGEIKQGKKKTSEVRGYYEIKKAVRRNNRSLSGLMEKFCGGSMRGKDDKNK